MEFRGLAFLVSTIRKRAGMSMTCSIFTFSWDRNLSPLHCKTNNWAYLAARSSIPGELCYSLLVSFMQSFLWSDKMLFVSYPKVVSKRKPKLNAYNERSEKGKVKIYWLLAKIRNVSHWWLGTMTSQITSCALYTV